MSEKINILLAGNNNISQKELIDFLSSLNYTVTSVLDSASAIKEIKHSGRYAVALLDDSLSHCDRVAICRHFSQDTQCSTYFILVSTKNDLDTLIKESVGDDYLSKPSDLQEVYTRVRVGIRYSQLKRDFIESTGTASPLLNEAKNIQSKKCIHDINNALVSIWGNHDFLHDCFADIERVIPKNTEGIDEEFLKNYRDSLAGIETGVLRITQILQDFQSTK